MITAVLTALAVTVGALFLHISFLLGEAKGLSEAEECLTEVNEMLKRIKQKIEESKDD